MKLINNVTIELFSRDGEGSAMNAWVPVPIEKVLQEQWHWHPERDHTQVYELPKQKVSLWVQQTDAENGTLTVYHYRFSRQRDTQAFAERLQQIDQEEREEVLAHLTQHLDAKGRLLLRLDLQEPRIVPGGECVFAKVNLAAYPKNEQTCREVAQQVLS